MSAPAEAERVAHATLTWIAEPGDQAMGALLRACSPAEIVTALVEGRIAGAGLAVFEHEPEVPPELLELENVVLAPHLGSATRDTREAMGMLAVSALRAVLLDGVRPPNAVV